MLSSKLSCQNKSFHKILSETKTGLLVTTYRNYVPKESVAFGNIVKEVTKAKNPQYVPLKYFREDLPQSSLHHLRWMMQKDLLGQDIFLLGPPGPRKRHLAMQYLELTNQEHEYVALSRDTTESDLKQRREIVQGTAKYFDQSAVRAAKEGRVLILEGIEKAERNVLPVLNNLLENREMHLEDGRLLIPAARYDKLLKAHGEEELKKWKLVRVDDNFRVIALGLPVPKLVFVEQNPHLTPYEIIYRLYPYKIFLKDGVTNLEDLLNKLEVSPQQQSTVSSLTEKIFNFLKSKSADGGNGYVETKYQNELLQNVSQSLNVGDVCIIGTSGCGKTMLINKVAELLGREVENIVLYQDMTSRDLIQQRTTLDNGDTIWKFSPLVSAAIEGKIAVLDGINRIHPSTLTVLHRLVHDRELQLHDGTRLIDSDRYNFLQQHFGLTKEQLHESGVFEIHPDFRIVAIGEPPNFQSAGGNWMSPEVLSLFVFHEMRTLSKQEELHIITTKFGHISRPMQQIVELAHILRGSPDPTLKNLSGHLSTRQLIRIAARMKSYPTDNIYGILEETFMIKFLPSLTRQVLEKTLEKVKITPSENNDKNPVQSEIKDGILTIGSIAVPVYKTKDLTKVPDILFYDVPQHLKLMEKLLQDFQLGYHLLLVGNQGVGKNKIADRFLELLNRPREYIQLHRDTTVQTLTTQPTVKDGLLIHEDSPLVKAIKHGHVLVIDEADKAPTHVTCILKTLVESGEMILSDGRRIVKKIPEGRDRTGYIETHPDFRIIVLANRPGFPFLGNDFFGALGDLFSSHAVENPSRESEIEMLKQYGPNVRVEIIQKLVDVFGELRALADQGVVNYPYSTREVVNVVKHLEKFPTADLEDVIFNVFDFDRYSPESIETLGEVLVKHGFSSKNIITAEYIAAKRAKENIQVTVNRYSGLDTKAPKHGKEDPKNEPHVGGNTWAGGTGGRDTAGLGGKGGPYRLDKGHKVHQLSDEEKNAVPEHIQRAAREMGRKAFQERLKEIGMSGYDHSVYSQFSDSVARQVQSLRVILGNLQAKNKERQWSRHQTSGELDDVKLIDGLLGEKTIFRRRAEQEPELGTPQIKPKLFRVVVDVSGSMYRLVISFGFEF
nr:von Willebrand factor A domain-containing protein 8 [Leptinotarsa decemlineata]